MRRFGLLLGSLSLARAAGSAPVAAEPAAASATADLGPAVGEKIPHDLGLPSPNADKSGFDALVGENGMSLFFVRSVDWCPFCKRQARDVNDRVAEFAERGLSVVFVSYDAVEKQQAFAEAEGFKPALLSDADIEAINAFGIRNESHEEGSRVYGIPHPVTFILDGDGVVRAKLFEEDFLANKKSYRNRPAVDAVLDQADAAFSS
ncbi:MAG: peroxiredoxin family protein [Parvularculaceae bacterium]